MSGPVSHNLPAPAAAAGNPVGSRMTMRVYTLGPDGTPVGEGRTTLVSTDERSPSPSLSYPICRCPRCTAKDQR